MASADRAANLRLEESRNEAAGGIAAQKRATQAQDALRPTAKAAAAPDTRSRSARNDSLLAAVAHGDVEAARQWLAVVGPDAQQDSDGRSALALAVLRSDLAMVRLLLAQGANRLARDRFGQTPQGYAAAQADPLLHAAFDLP